MRKTIAVLALAGLVACDGAQEPLSPAAGPADAAQFITGDGLVAGRVIITLEPGAEPEQVALQYGITPHYVYRHALSGFAGDIADAALAALRLDSRVRSIEQDQVMRANGTQSNAPWGIDRIDQRDLPLNETYTYAHTGKGVTAYIIDTGIRYTHREFARPDGYTTRAVEGVDVMENGILLRGNDCNGHGTHVAGSVGGNTYGVAKEVTLVSVRVLDCDGGGWTSGVIYGVDWVTAHHNANGGPSVANMSLGGGKSASLEQAVTNSVIAGVVYAIAAGNGTATGTPEDACTVSPAGVTGGGVPALTVGASNRTDARASWSNTGRCVDLYAPGVSITSASFLTDTYTETLSGTSMAAPHVAGVAALYLEQAPTASPASVKDALLAAATPNKITNPHPGTPNLLLYSVVDAPQAGGKCSAGQQRKGRC